MAQPESCAGRFPPLCASTFPEISDYDYETNIFTRGREDRVFRWEDIYVEANWIFRESTTSGEFELFTGSVTGASSSGELTLTYPSSTYTGFYGWILTGGYTTYVGYSGSKFYSGNLTGYTGEPFVANPIEGSKSIGLWCNSAQTPKIISSPIINNLSGIQDGQDHQVYLQAFCNKFTGSSPRIRAYLQAILSSSVVGYYDPINRSWTTTQPTGSFSLNTGTYTEIKYTFNASDLGFSTPDSYRLVVENLITGSFVTVDDIHIDQYLQKNPYLDYIIPTGYLVQMTPDLGWGNSQALFDGDGTSINPFLRTFGPFSIEQGNLTDNLDNTVSVTIDQQDFDNITSSIYKKYLWRAVAIAPNGDLGKAGLPEKFEFIGREIENSFTITEVRQDPTSVIKDILGTRSERIKVVVDSVENHPGLEYPSTTTWKLSIHLDGSARIIALQGKDSGGAITSKRYVELTNETYKLNSKALWNVFDEHGVLLDLRRLPNEANTDYKERLVDVNVNKGGSTFLGVVNGATREVGLKRITDAITISIPKNEFGSNIYPSLTIEFGSTYVNVKSPNMKITERLYVDPVYNTINLSKTIDGQPLYIVTKDGLEVPLNKCVIDIDKDRPSINRIRIDYIPAHGKYVDITYSYYETLLYKEYKDLFSLMQALNNLRDSSSTKLINATISSKLSGNENCLGLFIITGTLSVNNTISIPWSAIRLRRVSDTSFREYFLAKDNTFNETKFQEYVNELKYNSRTLWGHVEVDRDYWDAADSTKNSFDYVPTIFDPQITKFINSTLHPNVGVSYAPAPIHFIWMAGQSNSHGVGLISEDHDPWRNPNKFIEIWSTRTAATPRFEPLQAGVNTWGHVYPDAIPVQPWFGAEMQFADRITNMFATIPSNVETLNVKFVKTAFDGSHIDQWAPDSPDKFLEVAIYNFQQALAAAGGPSKVQDVTFIWYQGESNVFSQYYPHPYVEKLLTILQTVANSLGGIPLKVLLTRLHPMTKVGVPIVDEIIRTEIPKHTQALIEVANIFPNCQVISTEGLRLRDDQIHLDGFGLGDLGDRYFDAWLRAITADRKQATDEFFDGIEAWGRGFRNEKNYVMVNHGLEYTAFHPGVGYKNDLTPDVHVTYTKATEPGYVRSNVSEVMNDNNQIFFSGQR